MSLRHLLVVVAVFVLGAISGCATSSATSPGTSLVIRAVHVVDTEMGRRTGLRDVFVVESRIAAILPAGKVPVPSTAREINGEGRWLMPGLWDMHVHWMDEASLSVFPLHGVTGIRQMRGVAGHYATRHKKMEGTHAAPRVYLGSALVDGPRHASPPVMVVSDAKSARAAVKAVAASSADFLKVYDQIPRAAYLSLLEEARAAGVRVEGHVPIELGWEEASRIGVQRSFEHLHSLPIWASRDASELHARWLAYHSGLDYNNGISAEKRLESLAIHHAAYDTYDAARFARIAQALKAHQTWQTPTCMLWHARRGRQNPGFAPDPRERLIPPWMKQFWAGWWPQNQPEVVAADFALNERRHAFCLARTRDLHNAGVPLLAGTDVIMPYVFPGSSLHEELAQMVEAGLSPLAALQSATRNPAQFMQRRDLGVIRSGALADMVLVEGDPLTDIGNTRKIVGVAINGDWRDAQAIASGLQRVEKLAAAPVAADMMAASFSKDGLDAAMATWKRNCPAPPEQMDCGLFNAFYTVGMPLRSSRERSRVAEFEDWLETHGAQDPDLLATLAQAKFDQNDVAEARRVARRALQVAPGDPQLLWLLSAPDQDQPGSH